MLRKFGILPDHLNRKLQSAHIGSQESYEVRIFVVKKANSKKVSKSWKQFMVSSTLLKTKWKQFDLRCVYDIVWIKMNNNNKIAILRLFLAIFLPNVCLSSTKPRFRRCSMGLNLDCFKMYGLWCKWRPRTCLANFQNIAADKL
jgi:hypothetical protein